MMKGDNSANRPVLGDVTNRLGKRELPLVSGNSGNKIGDVHGPHDKILDNEDGDSQFTKRVCQGVENIVKEKCEIRSVGNNNDKGDRARVSPRPCSEIYSLRGNVISGISKVATKVKDSNLFVSSLHLGSDHAAIDNVVEVAEATRDSCASSMPLPITSRLSSDVQGKCNEDEGQATSKVAEGDSHFKEFATGICGMAYDGIELDNFTMGKHGVVECSRGPESQVSGSFKLEKCISLRGHGCSDSGASVDLIKACSCSFCVKAAYMWSDLHYQDMKGRIAALKKSQKEASFMVERSCRNKGIDKQSQGNCYTVSKLESDLTGQWRSLFLHMEDIFEREGNQLEASLLTLKDLRDNCKTELEMVNGMPKEKH